MGLPSPDLTERQRRLAQAAVDPTCLTVTEAARRAGYGHLSTASESLRKPQVQREIARLQAKRSDTARAILPRAFRNVSQAVERDEEGTYSLGAVKVLGEYVERVSEDDAPQSHEIGLRIGALRFLRIWYQEHSRWHGRGGCECGRLQKAEAVMARLEAVIP